MQQCPHRDLNIDAKVKFLVNGTEINVEKKGDGTKRRITLALLEYKKDKIIKGDSESTIYLLDEPDTHLHVKAQIELLDTLRSFAEKGDQIILTTHSPFIINAVNSNQIRLVEEKENCSQIKHLKQDSEVSNKILKALGIENTYLFFAKYIILAEGETEQEFIQSHYTKKYRKSISSDLIKIIPTKGINNIYGFARAILELHNRGNIFCIYDNDASEETKKLIDELQLHDTQRFILGDKEFEDCFDSTSLHGCWVSYLSECSKDTPENWTVKNIDEAKDKCTQDKSLKFSKQLVSLSAGSKKMTKPIFGRLLGEYVDEDNTPPRLKELFTLLK